MATSSSAAAAERIASRYIAQRDSGPWSEQDAAELQQWLEQATLHQVVYYRLNAAWQESGRLQALRGDASRIHSLATDFPERSSHTASRRFPRSWHSHALAAGIALAAVAALLGVFRDRLFAISTYSTEVGSFETVQMADGSRIALNTDSLLRVHLDEQERRIELEKGEAFFDVAKDPNRPFTVVIGGRRVTAVGTQFVVRRDEGDEVFVGVTEGAVRMDAVKSSRQDPSGGGLLLHAGAMLRTGAGDALLQERPVQEIEQQLTWRSGTITFNRTPLAEAVKEINRYNSRKIVIDDASIANIQIGGVFAATKLDPFIHLLEGGFNVQATEERGRIVLSAR